MVQWPDVLDQHEGKAGARVIPRDFKVPVKVSGHAKALPTEVDVSQLRPYSNSSDPLAGSSGKRKRGATANVNGKPSGGEAAVSSDLTTAPAPSTKNVYRNKKAKIDANDDSSSRYSGGAAAATTGSSKYTIVNGVLKKKEAGMCVIC